MATTDPPASRGRVAERSSATRAALIELAAELFAEQGYAQTSVRDITRRGALTSGAIYGHFRNKADLLAEAISVRTAEELEVGSGLGGEVDYVETLTRLARSYPERSQLRALLVEGAAAAHTDAETRARLSEEQLAHLNVWIDGYERERDRMGIDPSVDLHDVVLYTWAAELGLGVLEAIGIEPRSPTTWADVHNRLARGLKLPPDDQGDTPPPSRRRP